MRVEAEQAWLKLGEDIGRPVAILRLSGIYGPGRNALVNLENGTARRLVKPGQVFNRIHCDDIAGALWQLIEGNNGGIFNVTDDEPAPPQDVVTYAASLMGVDAAAGNSLRHRPTFAHGAVLLWREQTRRQCGDQGGGLSLSLSGLPRRLRPYVGKRRLARRRGAQPDEGLERSEACEAVCRAYDSEPLSGSCAGVR